MNRPTFYLNGNTNNQGRYQDFPEGFRREIRPVGGDEGGNVTNFSSDYGSEGASCTFPPYFSWKFDCILKVGKNKL